MSTICKIDRNVRLDRYLRKEQRRQMQKDIVSIDGFLARGYKRLAFEAGVRLTSEYVAAPDYLHLNIASNQTGQLLMELTTRRTITAMMLSHVSEIMLDPRRSGATKEKILAKLGLEEAA